MKDEKYITSLVNYWSEKATEYYKIKGVGTRVPSEIEDAMAKNGFYIEDIKCLYEFFSKNNFSFADQIINDNCSKFISQIKKNIQNKYSFFVIISICISKCLSFKGNATIKEFWSYILFYVITLFIFSKIFGCSNEDFLDYITTVYNSVYYLGFFLKNHDYIIYSKFIGLVWLQILFFPTLLSISVRRLRDAGIKVWVNFIYYLPILLILILKLEDNLGSGFIYDIAEWLRDIVTIIFVVIFCKKSKSNK